MPNFANQCACFVWTVSEPRLRQNPDLAEPAASLLTRVETKAGFNVRMTNGRIATVQMMGGRKDRIVVGTND